MPYRRYCQVFQMTKEQYQAMYNNPEVQQNAGPASRKVAKQRACKRSQMMPEYINDKYIGNTLIGDARINAAGFIEYLLKSELQFERGKGYWADKLYWMIKYKGEYVCFVLISGGKDNTELDGWVIWSDDSGSNWFADDSSDERLKEIAWKYVDICGNCGGCKNPGGSRKTIFGKGFDNVCLTAMKFDNPDAETVECVKKLMELRKSDINRSAAASRLKQVKALF